MMIAKVGRRVLGMSSPTILGMAFLLAPMTLQAQSPADGQQSDPSAVNDTQAPPTQNPPSTGATTSSTDAQQKPSAVTNAPQKAAGPSAQEIANQANNPAAPVTLIQFRDILLPNASAPGVVPGVAGASGTVNSLQVQPVLPIGPFKSFPHVQLMKLTMPIAVSISGSGSTQQFSVSGVGDLQVFDLLTIKQSWGRWGFGPALVFPTASANALGAGKYQAGPSFALIYTGIKNLTAGAIVQNPISYAGSPNRPSVNNMIITPTFTFNLKEGWFVGMSDYNWNFDWEKGGALTFPIGVQVGKIITIGKQPFSLSAEVGGVAARPANSPNPGWLFGFELSPIFNWHLGPGEKVHLRKQH